MKKDLFYLFLIAIMVLLPIAWAATKIYENIEVDIGRDGTSTQWNIGDDIDATKVGDADLGDLSTFSGAWRLDNFVVDSENIETWAVTTVKIETDAVTAPKVDWGLGTDQVSAADLPIADSGSYYTGTEVETALQEIGAGTTLDSRYVNVAGDTMTGGLTIDGSADEVQLTVQGNATQTSDLFLVEKSDGTDYFHIEESGELHLMHTADHNDDRSFEIDTDGAAFGDVKSVDINYTTGAIVKGEDEAVILVNIDETLAEGGDIFGFEVLTTEAAAGSTTTVYGLKAAALVGPVHQDSGTFANPTIATDNTASTIVENMRDADILTLTAIFEANNQYIIIGETSVFEEIEFILTTGSSGAGIKPTFGYSTAGSHQFTAFSPVDGTNGFRNTGVIAWDASDLTNHGLNTDTTPDTYCIKITRTRANLSTSPVLGYAKVAATTEYLWDKSGDINIRNITASQQLKAEHLYSTDDMYVTDEIQDGDGANGVTVVNIFDKGGDTLDDVPDGTTYKLVLAPVAAGDILYSSDGVTWEIIPKGADNHVFTMTPTIPNWEAAAGTPAGNDTEVQYNNSGAFGSDAGFTTDKAGSMILSAVMKAMDGYFTDNLSVGVAQTNDNYLIEGKINLSGADDPTGLELDVDYSGETTDIITSGINLTVDSTSPADNITITQGLFGIVTGVGDYTYGIHVQSAGTGIVNTGILASSSQGTTNTGGEFHGTTQDVELGNRTLKAGTAKYTFSEADGDIGDRDETDGSGNRHWSSYVELMQAIAPGGDATFTNVALSAYGVGDGDVCDILMENADVGNEMTVGVRTDGSALNRYTDLHEAEGNGVTSVVMRVRAAGATAIIELYEEVDANCNSYLIGYWD